MVSLLQRHKFGYSKKKCVFHSPIPDGLCENKKKQKVDKNIISSD